MKTILGLVGEKGSGKQTFVNFLKKIAPNLKMRQLRFSDILAQTLILWDLPITRANLQKLSISMDKTFGASTLANAAKFSIEGDDADIIIFDGARRKSEIDLIKKFKNSLLVYITADRDLRYQRLKVRSEKVGETGLTFEQFMQEEKIKTEVEIPKFGKKADIKLVNNGSLEDFKQKIENLYIEHLTPNSKK